MIIISIPRKNYSEANKTKIKRADGSKSFFANATEHIQNKYDPRVIQLLKRYNI
ncbi:hypothetical protein [Christiangramia sp.]|jgi:hypothetical protein|uniref:Uncharacterized protein n=1 Tax=Christiangramia flava JLT2011 TaxID=1229726 RepID=A0A1L7I867_9FLAO|nr:hypothetical protein [Christiangramia sp.]APU69780.1 hypothetical protein GRFL_3056 [Christiangramia flava JLT2011]OSS39187.1 hypothetical protein C723_1733 [Christiangramia flava JLT2011]|tara:strand:+ start:353 stop:514 length:162 start_codon:yes stop_codon:yes gene_type:complete